MCRIFNPAFQTIQDISTWSNGSVCFEWLGCVDSLLMNAIDSVCTSYVDILPAFVTAVNSNEEDYVS